MSNKDRSPLPSRRTGIERWSGAPAPSEQTRERTVEQTTVIPTGKSREVHVSRVRRAGDHLELRISVVRDRGSWFVDLPSPMLDELVAAIGELFPEAREARR